MFLYVRLQKHVDNYLYLKIYQIYCSSSALYTAHVNHMCRQTHQQPFNRDFKYFNHMSIFHLIVLHKFSK